MKKILLLSGILLTAGIAYAYPNVDMTVGGTPFQLIQQQNFQKMEFNDYKQFKDAKERPASLRTDSPKQLQEEYKIKNLKQPAKIQLGNPEVEEVDVAPANMELIQDNGKIKIKYAD